MKHKHNYQVVNTRLASLFLSALLFSIPYAWSRDIKGQKTEPKANQASAEVEDVVYFPLRSKSRVSRRVVFIIYIHDPKLNPPQSRYKPPTWLKISKPPAAVNLTLVTSDKYLPVKIDIIKNVKFTREMYGCYVECHGAVTSKHDLPQKVTLVGSMTFADKKGKTKHTLHIRIPVTASIYAPQDPT